MNTKNAVIVGPQRRKKIARLCARLSGLIVLLMACEACGRRQAEENLPQTPVSSATSVLNYSCALSPAEGFGGLTAINQATVAAEKDRLVIHATGADPQLGFSVMASNHYAISLDIGIPVATTLELFYQVQKQSYSAERVVQASLKAGRHQLLLTIDDPLLSGEMRLDPGQLAGDYSLYSLQIFSFTPVAFVRPARPQAELASSFDTSAATTLFSAKTSEALGKIKPLGGVLLEPEPRGLMVKASGNDPGLLLPEFEMRGQSIVKIVIFSPAATTLQLFYKTRGQLDYNETHVSNCPLQQGENTVYLDIPTADVSGALRLDPGTVAGDYLVKEIEVRASAAAGPP